MNGAIIMGRNVEGRYIGGGVNIVVICVSIHGNVRLVILWYGLSLLTQEHVVTSLE